jgi:predicted nucleic acid-binding protein
MGFNERSSPVERLKAAVVDSSILLKWFRPNEPHADTANAILRAYLDERLELTIPDLAAYEVANVMRYRTPEVDAAQAAETLFNLRIPIYRLNYPTIRRAIQASVQRDISVYDATFLAVAETLRLQLVTADKRFYQAIRSLPGTFFLSDLKLG